MMPHRALKPEIGTRAQLLEVDWEDLGIRLTAYAVWKGRNLRWRTGQPDLLPAGKTPQDIAAEAVLKVVEGSRTWDSRRGPLLPFLRRVVDSLLNQLAEGADNRLQRRLGPAAEAPIGDAVDLP